MSTTPKTIPAASGAGSSSTTTPLAISPAAPTTSSKSAADTTYLTAQPIAIFYDNDIINFKNNKICKCILSIPVSGGKLYWESDAKRESEYTKNLSNEGKHIFKLIKTIYNRGKPDELDSTSGISETQINSLITLITTSKDVEVTDVIFDFDRTLSQVEGFLYPSGVTYNTQQVFDAYFKPTYPLDTRKGLANYYFGGDKRIANLKKLWGVLYDYDIDVWVLTNNNSLNPIDSSGREKGGTSIKYIQTLLGDAGLIVESDKILFNTYRDKYTTIAMNDHFKSKCGKCSIPAKVRRSIVPSLSLKGGRKSGRTRKKRRHTRQTRHAKHRRKPRTSHTSNLKKRTKHTRKINNKRRHKSRKR